MKPVNLSVFDERLHLIAVAGLLHDAGKVLQPAAMPLEPQTSNLRQMICPSDFRTGQATHLHVLYTAATFDLAVSNFGGLDREELFRVACYHHRPSTDSLDQNILTKADWLASGHDRRSATEPADSISALAPVLAGVEWPEPARSSEGLGLPARLLSLDEDSFLPSAEQSREEYRDRCRELTGRLVDGLKQDFRNPTECVDGLLGLTERVFHSIPASRDRKQQPDVTLFDHSRIVAAFATCLAKQFSGAPKPASELHGQFRLVAISLGGIQKFIFRVVTPLDEREGEQDRDAGGLTGARGMARRLRARSLYVGLLSWLAARRMLEDVGLPSTNLIANAGGRAILLLPETPDTQQRLQESLAKLEEWFVEAIGGVLRLDIASSDVLSDADFSAEQFPQTFRDLDRRLAAARYRLSVPNLRAESGWLEDGWIQSRESLPIDRNDFNADLAQLGRYLPRAKYLSLDSGDFGIGPVLSMIGYEVRFHDTRPASGRCFALDVDDADLSMPLFVTAKHVPRATPDALQRLSRMPRDERLEKDDAPKEDDLLTFEHLARLASDEDGREIPHAMLGALKADVDRLGTILGYGLGQRVSFGRLTSLARTLDLFFKGFLTRKLQEQFPFVYTVFAGGDDVFLIGPWYDLVRLIGKLRGWFDRLTCGNPNLTFSAGLIFAGATTPVAHLAHVAEEALDLAKDSGRDRITIGSVTLTWAEFDKAMTLHRLLLSELRGHEGDRPSLNRSLVYRLLQYAKQGRGHHPGRDRPAPLDMKWRAQLSYDLKRNLPAPSDGRPGLLKLRTALQQVVTPQDAAVLEVACSLSLYVLRGAST